MPPDRVLNAMPLAKLLAHLAKRKGLAAKYHHGRRAFDKGIVRSISLPKASAGILLFRRRGKQMEER